MKKLGLGEVKWFKRGSQKQVNELLGFQVTPCVVQESAAVYSSAPCLVGYSQRWGQGPKERRPDRRPFSIHCINCTGSDEG